MKVYVVLRDVMYEGSAMLSVHKTKDSAEEAASVARAKIKCSDVSVIVEEWNVKDPRKKKESK